jgi:anthranilate synthase component 2
MKLIIIDNYDSFVYNLARYVEESCSGEVIIFRNDKVDYTELIDADGILLSPGPGVPSEAGDLMKIIDIYHTQKPILGVCLGHQAISEYFGCELIRQDDVYHGKSSMITHFSTNYLFDSIPEKFEVGRYHSWSVDQNISPVLEVTARSSTKEIMALQHADLPITGVQFHPESILTPHGRTMIQNWIQSITPKN